MSVSSDRLRVMIDAIRCPRRFERIVVLRDRWMSIAYKREVNHVVLGPYVREVPPRWEPSIEGMRALESLVVSTMRERRCIPGMSLYLCARLNTEYEEVERDTAQVCGVEYQPSTASDKLLRAALILSSGSPDFGLSMPEIEVSLTR